MLRSASYISYENEAPEHYLTMKALARNTSLQTGMPNKTIRLEDTRWRHLDDF
jgi:hypothetical protein